MAERKRAARSGSRRDAAAVNSTHTTGAEAAPATKQPAKRRAPRKKAAEEPPAPRGLKARELLPAGDGAPGRREPAAVASLRAAVQADGGSVLAVYREPAGGHFVLLCGLPTDQVAPTPFQRDLSEAHAARLAEVVDRLDHFLDPIIAVRVDGAYWTPNGLHRLEAMRRLGCQSIVALVLPEQDMAYRILALNTEKAHNLREKALEVVRMARSLAEKSPERLESELALEFEEPPLITLGLAYEARGRFSGGAYHSILRQTDGFLDIPLPEALAVRQQRAERLLELDDAVADIVTALRERGLSSPYLKAYVVARINPIRFQRTQKGSFESVIDTMLNAARQFDPAAVRPDQIARASGPPEEI